LPGTCGSNGYDCRVYVAYRTSRLDKRHFFVPRRYALSQISLARARIIAIVTASAIHVAGVQTFGPLLALAAEAPEDAAGTSRIATFRPRRLGVITGQELDPFIVAIETFDRAVLSVTQLS